MRRIRRWLFVLLAALVTLQGTNAADAPTNTIRLATTTSLDNSGLLGAILPIFTKETSIEVHVLAQGTGQALDTARRGDADLVLVHDPEAVHRGETWHGSSADRLERFCHCRARRRSRAYRRRS